jgi:ATP-dependent RNA helicase DDX52/ROK1
MDTLRSIANVMKLSGCDVPDWMLTLKKMKTGEKRQAAKRAPERHRISTVSGYDLKKKEKRRLMIENTKKSKATPTTGEEAIARMD